MNTLAFMLPRQQCHRIATVDQLKRLALTNAMVTREIKLFQNYFSLRRRVSEKNNNTAISHPALFLSLSSSCWDAWSAGGWCTTFPDRDWQESNASHSRSAGRHVSISEDFCGNSAFQCHMPDQLVNCFWVPIVTIPITDLHFANF